jgi:hypothetical protein
MKKCFKCFVEKPLTEFYKHSQMADGYLNKCKSCTKQDAYDRRFGAKRNYILAYDLKRAKNPERAAKNLARSLEYKKQFAERKQAQSLLRSAVLKGDVIPMVCWCCGKKAEAHHPDYSRPLDVVWLCSSHHKQAHALTKGL